MMYQYTLQFSSPAHFGLEGIGQERVEQRVRSDTLWGAIIQKWLLLFQDDADSLCLNPPFHLSSTFPVIGGVHFFPVPSGSLDHLISRAALSDDPPVSLKALKKVLYLAEPLFLRTLSGKPITFEDVSPQPDDVFRPGMVFPEPGESGSHRSKNYSGSAVIQRPRLEIDRLRGGGVEGNFFYCSDQFFQENGGLFFLASFTDAESQEKFEGALRLLGDSGLGADRSIGRGLFMFHRKEYVLQKVNKPTAYLLLSLYHPKKDEVEKGVLEGAGTAYSLVKRSGHADSHLVSSFRRRDLWMLAEGSVLVKKPVGDICPVLAKSDQPKIPHNVYRNGRAFYLPMNRPPGEV